jgi:hypothetical protein
MECPGCGRTLSKVPLITVSRETCPDCNVSIVIYMATIRAKRLEATRRGDDMRNVILRTIEANGRQRQVTLRVDVDQASSVEVRSKDKICLLATERSHSPTRFVLVNLTTKRTFELRGDEQGREKMLDEIRSQPFCFD